MDEDDLPEGEVKADAGSSAGRRLQRLAEEKVRVLSASLAGQDDTLMKRVALVLNHFPDTRDSDVGLQLRYWTEFGYWNGGPIAGKDLYDLPKLTSLSRARAKIQSQLGLFQASASIKKRRRLLEEDEKESARRAPSRSPSLTVFADEQMLDSVSEGLFEKVRPQRGHKVPPDKLGTLKAVARESVPYSDLIEWCSTVFGKHFSKSELEEIGAFFSSPTGKKYTALESEMKAELGAMTFKLIEERLRAALNRRGLETVDQPVRKANIQVRRPPLQTDGLAPRR